MVLVRYILQIHLWGKWFAQGLNLLILHLFMDDGWVHIMSKYDQNTLFLVEICLFQPYFKGEHTQQSVLMLILLSGSGTSGC